MPGTLYDLTGFLVIFFGGAAITLATLGLTLRYGLKPLLDARAQRERALVAETEVTRLEHLLLQQERELRQLRLMTSGRRLDQFSSIAEGEPPKTV